MRPYILFFALAVMILGSCTTAYKTGQTPDDVYYSPTRPQDEYVVTEKQETEDRYYSGSQDYYTDRYLRMRLSNPYRWSALDDYYFNNPYAYNYYGSYNNFYSPWNSYWGWNSYFNPYYVSPIFIKNPVRFREIPSRATVFNPKSYLNTSPANVAPMKNGTRGNSNMSYYNPSTNNGGGSTRYNNSNSNSRNYSGQNSNSDSRSNRSSTSPSNSTPTRSYTPSSSSGSSSSGSRSTTTPSRPPR